jgi:hypothetical protein
MTNDQRIEIAAEAMWKNRAAEAHLTRWRKVTWQQFCMADPAIAAVYRDNARTAIEAIDRAGAKCA